MCLSKEFYEDMVKNYQLVDKAVDENGSSLVGKFKNIEWKIGYLEGTDPKYCRIAFSVDNKMYRRILTIGEFYGGGIVD